MAYVYIASSNTFRNSCALTSRFLIVTLITIILTACDERFPHE